MLYRQALEALHQFGEKWILDVGDDQAINMALAGPQGARMGVGVIACSLDRRPDPLFSTSVHRCCAVHHARNGGCGNSGPLGYFPDVHACGWRNWRLKELLLLKILPLNFATYFFIWYTADCG